MRFCTAFPTSFNQCSTTYAASVILGSGLTGILGDSVNSQNAETQDSLGFGRLPKLTILQGSDGKSSGYSNTRRERETQEVHAFQLPVRL